ncbi:hypothetical protein LTR10_007837 [Elasticomyces elasticus]|nr:hypothetical protein LTR10_007837 [Elasticomyces elasticus]KAK4970837.1 hypothetical protein LTR42_007814 [Elasticomyces elasticus]
MATTDWRDSPPTLVEATKRLQETMKNARDGKKADALNGVISVVQSAFAAVLKGEVDGTTAVREECDQLRAEAASRNASHIAWKRDKDQKLEAKDLVIAEIRAVVAEREEKIRALEAQVKAANVNTMMMGTKLEEQAAQKDAQQRTLIAHAKSKIGEQRCIITDLKAAIVTKDEAFGALKGSVEAKDAELTTAKANVKVPAIDIIITQAGYRTRCYNVDEQQALLIVLGEYCKDTDQSIDSMLVRINDMHSSGRVVDPGEENIEPKPLKQGKMSYQAFEVIKVEPSVAKRKAAGGESAGSGKKQKV